MKRFGKKLRKLREGRGLSYSQLAKALGFHRGHLANIEIGARIPSVDLVEKIVEYFEVSFDEMMDDKMDVGTRG